jgi:hypothetical protein
MQSAQVAPERRIVSTFVHDQLGQNYMQLKLDQLSTDDSLQQSGPSNSAAPA